MMAARRVMVTVAPTGGMASKESNPNLPTQPEEIAESDTTLLQGGGLHRRAARAPRG